VHTRPVRYVACVLALLFGTACPRVPRPERTIVDGREVFLIQEAHCGIGDCEHGFYINRIEYFPTCGRLPDALRREISGGTLFAVADPDASDLPERRATVVPGVEPRWLVGVRILGPNNCGYRPRWSVAWPLGAEAETAICSSRSNIGKVLDFGCE
jgi:hypothetical protein